MNKLYTIKCPGDAGTEYAHEVALDWIRAAAFCGRDEYSMSGPGVLVDLGNRETLAAQRSLGLISQRQRDLALHLQLDAITVKLDQVNLSGGEMDGAVYIGVDASEADVGIWPDFRFSGISKQKPSGFVYRVEHHDGEVVTEFIDLDAAVTYSAGIVEQQRVAALLKRNWPSLMRKEPEPAKAEQITAKVGVMKAAKTAPLLPPDPKPGKAKSL